MGKSRLQPYSLDIRETECREEAAEPTKKLYSAANSVSFGRRSGSADLSRSMPAFGAATTRYVADREIAVMRRVCQYSCLTLQDRNSLRRKDIFPSREETVSCKTARAKPQHIWEFQRDAC